MIFFEGLVPQNHRDWAYQGMRWLKWMNDPYLWAYKPARDGTLVQEKHLQQFLQFQQLYRKYLGMPPKKKQSNDWKGFLNHRLSEEHKAIFLSWDFEGDDVWLFISQANTEGYRFSTSFNTQNSTYNAILQCTDADSPNYGYSLSAYAGDWYTAVRLVLFKHIVVFQYLWDVQKASNPRDNWG